MLHLYISMFIFLVLISVAIIVASSDLRVWRKLAVVTMLGTAGLLSYRALNSIYGYPTVMQQDLSDAVMLGYSPDKEAGMIYLWVQSAEGGTPRSYAVPYDTKLEKYLASKRKYYKGRPYRVDLKASIDPTNRFNKTVEDVEVYDMGVLPPKTNRGVK